MNIPEIKHKKDSQTDPKREMSTTTRLLRSSNKPLGRVFASSSAWPSSSSVKTVRCTTSKGGLINGDKKIRGNTEREPITVSVKAASVTTTLEVTERSSVDLGRELASLLAIAIDAMRETLIRPILLKPRPWKLHIQMFIQNSILNCRFFTLFAIAGTLLGSVLCFMEGSFLIVESYLQYFNSLLSQKLDQQNIIHLLIEAIDMFLFGTAMLIFGMGLYVMFVGSKKEGVASLPRSNLFGLFHFKTIPAWVEMKSISQAKSKVGHAMMMILHVGVLEKFKSIAIVTSLDLACFAASIFISSASIFLLSGLSFGSSSSMGDK